MKIKEIVKEASTDAKIIANDGKTITIGLPDGTQIQKPISTALAQNQQGQTVFNLTSQPGQQAQQAQGQPQQQLTPGSVIPVNTDPNTTKPTQTMGTEKRTFEDDMTDEEECDEVELENIRKLSGI